MTPDSLDELPLFKRHYTSGRRRTMDGYVDLDDSDDDDERDRPTRSEPADFGGGESTGVQDL